MGYSGYTGYKGYTPAQAAANKRWASKQATLYIRVPPEERDTIQAAAEAAGQSLNAYTRQAIQERMERDNQPRQRPLDVKPGDVGGLVAYDRETGGINWTKIESNQ